MRIFALTATLLLLICGCRKDDVIIPLTSEDMVFFSTMADTLRYTNSTADTINFYLLSDTTFTPSRAQFPTTKGRNKIYTYHELTYTDGNGITLILSLRHGLATYRLNNEGCLLGYSAVAGNPALLTINESIGSEYTVLSNYGGAGTIHPFAVQLINENNTAFNKIVVVPEVGVLDYTTETGVRWRLL